MHSPVTLQNQYSLPLHFNYKFSVLFVFSVNVCCDIYLLPFVSKFPNQFKRLTCTSVRHSRRRSEHFSFQKLPKIFYFSIQRSKYKIANERQADFWHPREYKTAVASLHFASGTLSYV